MSGSSGGGTGERRGFGFDARLGLHDSPAFHGSAPRQPRVGRGDHPGAHRPRRRAVWRCPRGCGRRDVRMGPGQCGRVRGIAKVVMARGSRMRGAGGLRRCKAAARRSRERCSWRRRGRRRGRGRPAVVRRHGACYSCELVLGACYLVAHLLALLAFSAAALFGGCGLLAFLGFTPSRGVGRNGGRRRIRLWRRSLLGSLIAVWTRAVRSGRPCTVVWRGEGVPVDEV